MISKRFGDITEYSGDCIFNSLGERHRMMDEPGMIFWSILKATKYNRELAYEIRKNSYIYNMGDSFVTNSYGLPCKKIVHIVTPFRWDDPDLSALSACVTNALSLAYENGCRTMCLPIIGSGYNGYSNDEAFSIILSCVTDFENNHQDVDISIFKYHKTGVLEKCSRSPFPIEGETFFVEAGFHEGERGFEHDKPYLKTRDGFEEINSRPVKKHVGDILDDLREKHGNSGMISIGEVIDEYIDANRDCYYENNFLTKNKKSDPLLMHFWDCIYKRTKCIASFDDKLKAKNGKKLSKEDSYKSMDEMKQSWHFRKNVKEKYWLKPSKIDVILAGIVIKMGRKDILKLCTFCGYFLSEYDAGDCVIMECLNLGREGNRLETLVDEYPAARGYSSWYEIPTERCMKIYLPIIE